MKNKTITHRFILLVDLHLSDRTDTAAYHALLWAVDRVNRERPDFLAVAGDVTTFGTAGVSVRGGHGRGGAAAHGGAPPGAL